MEHAQKFIDKRKTDQNAQTDSNSSFEDGDAVSGRHIFIYTNWIIVANIL